MKKHVLPTTRAVTACKRGKWIITPVLLLLFIVGLVFNIKSTKKQIAERKTAIEILDKIQFSWVSLIDEILAQSEKLGGLFLPVGVIYTDDEGRESETLIACVIRTEALGWDPDEFISVRLNKDGQVEIRRIGLEARSLVQAARKNTERMDAEGVSKCLKKYRNKLGPALKRYLKAHLEASNRRSENRTGGFSFYYSQ